MESEEPADTPRDPPHHSDGSSNVSSSSFKAGECLTCSRFKTSCELCKKSKHLSRVTQDTALDYFEKNLTTELLHIFNECGVPVGLQYKFGQHFKNVKKFSTYADSRSDVRAALKADHSLEATNQDTRAAVASVVSAWESCREFSAKESELKAEARVLGVSRPITQTEHQATRISYEKTFGSLDEVVEPSADYLSTKMEEVENGETAASPLSDVTSKRKVKTLGVQTSVDAGGHVRIVKQRNKGSLPQNTEDLRTALRVEGNAWVFLGSKYKNKVFFTDLTPSVWLDYSNYLLGDKVYLMQIPSPSGKGKSEQVALRPPLTAMINYEFELRKEAVKRAFRDSRALKDTLLEVQNDAQLKEQFFTSPIALQHRGTPAPNTWYERPSGQPWKWRRNDKGPGKGKGKDSHKGKEQKGKKGKGQGHGELASRMLRLLDVGVSRRLRDGSLLSGSWMLWAASNLEALAGTLCEGECQSHGQQQVTPRAVSFCWAGTLWGHCMVFARIQ